MKHSILFTYFIICVGFCLAQKPKAPLYASYEITLHAKENYSNPYTDVDVYAVFVNGQHDTLIRPAFWDGGNTWKIRFCPTVKNQLWHWFSYSSNTSDEGLHGQSGVFTSTKIKTKNRLLANGPLMMSPQKRNVIQHSGKPFFMVAVTAWASPFRATTNQIEQFANSSRKKGFNTVLLAVLQTDMKAEGPDERNTIAGFKRTFSDFTTTHLNNLVVSYFQYLDKIINIYLAHEMVPVFAPLMHGFGWKGLDVIGNKVQPAEYERYCKYLLARYGSQPAMWLLSVDGAGYGPGIEECGGMLEKWDCYHQPTGLHYSPCDDYIAKWAVNLPNPEKYCLHGNKTHQDKNWLDFQWAQTGHDGFHIYTKVEKMYNNLPVKAVADGEPTYEGMNDGKSGLGWWQGEDAWNQLMHGGTMGVVYGAAALWQWKITADEPGWESWTDQPLSWKGAMEMKGGSYVGLISKILKPYNLTDIERRRDTSENKYILAREGSLYIAYLNNGGEINIKNLPGGMHYKWVNPKSGNVFKKGVAYNTSFSAPDGQPWVLIVANKE